MQFYLHVNANFFFLGHFLIFKLFITYLMNFKKLKKKKRI